MRALVVIILLAALAACAEPRAADGQTQAAEPAVLMGQFNAASATARSATGNVSIERGGILFDRGIVLYTRALNPRRGYERIARDGDSYAAVAVGPGDLTIELRRVTQQTLSNRALSLCGGDAPSYVALAYEPRVTAVTLLVFAGDEPPGPEATTSRLCATFAYAARDGARTRQGVVLQ